MPLKQNLKDLAHRYGIEVRRYDVTASPEGRLFRLIETQRIDTVIDIGANAGEYGRLLRQRGYKGAIVSFEPLQDEHDRLLGAAEGDPQWHVAPRMALGAENREVEINVAGNSWSSSILPMHERHATAAPQSRYVGVQRVPMRRLDDVSHPAIGAGQTILLKIDTQGYEMPVLHGAQRLLERIAGLQLELSLVPLYDGQTLYLESIQWLRERGFELWDMIPGFIDHAAGRLMQFDGVFFRGR
jgi:FkbM family methyltransferase